jgi:MraZ protein
MANFMGSYTHAVDHKGRVNIPVKFRKYIPSESDEALVVTRGLDGCLFVYPFDEWEKADEKLRALPITQANNRAFLRMLLSHAVTTSVDRQGRMAIPRNLLEMAGIESQVLIVGILDHFELWSPSVYEGRIESIGQTYESAAEQILF